LNGLPSLSTRVATLLAQAGESRSGQNIYTQLLESRALARAQQIDTQHAAAPADSGARWPLHGVIVAIKDNIDVRECETSCGSLALARPAARDDAAIVTRVERLGAIVIGKTNLDEAALGASGRNARFGRCINPLHPDRLSGGSSSGSAAAVAAGHVNLGIGTDTLGSVRIPAALCGIVGFKPTHAMLAMTGVAPLHPPFDTLGLLTGSLQDAAHAAGALLNSTGQRAPEGAMTMRLMVLPEATLSWVEDGVADAYRRCVRLLQTSAAVQIQELPRFEFVTLARAAFWEVAGGFARTLVARGMALAEYPSAQAPAHAHAQASTALGAELRQLLQRALSLPSAVILDGQRLLHSAAQFLHEQLLGADALLTPTCPVNGVGAQDALPNAIAAFTAPANLAGLPALAWPQAVGPQRTVSLQLIGRTGDDLRLLAMADRIDRLLQR